MRHLCAKITERLFVSYLPVYVLYSVTAVVLTAAWWQRWGPLALCILPAAFLMGELLLRALLYLAYGSHYRFAIFTYFLQNDDRYGTGLAKGARSREIPFLLFDTFIFPPDTGRLLELQKNKELRNDYTVNSLGFRGKEFDPQHKGARMRIFCVGGSTTACDSNDDSEAWPAQLERVLRAQGYDIEVINAGVPGWYSYKDYVRFREEISAYQADVVLIHEGWNEEFEYSSLSLGARWSPGRLRNLQEERMLYCPPSRFLSSPRFLSKLLAVQALRKKFVFNPTMSFQNLGRWHMLRRREYIAAWVDNLIMMAQLAQQKNILLYSIDYPSLVSLQDTDKDRAVYVAHSRLTPLFAHYQAIAKARVSQALALCAGMIPLLTVQDVPQAGTDRMELFHDEMHLAPQGNAWLGQTIAEKLLKDSAFLARYKAPGGSNVSLDPALLAHIRAEAGRNPYSLEQFIGGIIDTLRGPQVKNDAEIPADRYTTF